MYSFFFVLFFFFLSFLVWPQGFRLVGLISSFRFKENQVRTSEVSGREFGSSFIILYVKEKCFFLVLIVCVASMVLKFLIFVQISVVLPQSS